MQNDCRHAPLPHVGRLAFYTFPTAPPASLQIYYDVKPLLSPPYLHPCFSKHPFAPFAPLPSMPPMLSLAG